MHCGEKRFPFNTGRPSNKFYLPQLHTLNIPNAADLQIIWANPAAVQTRIRAFRQTINIAQVFCFFSLMFLFYLLSVFVEVVIFPFYARVAKKPPSSSDLDSFWMCEQCVRIANGQRLVLCTATTIISFFFSTET